MNPVHPSPPGISEPAASRLAAIDVARGVAMLLVVAMHSILGVESAAGQTGVMHALVDFATSFRVPAFFLISGLFLRRAMQLGWIDLYAKRIHGLIVLYLIWLAIHLTLRSLPGVYADPLGAIFGSDGFFVDYARALVEPYGLLWFVHMMIAFIIAARLVFQVPKALPLAILLAALLETLRLKTGSTLIDEFSARFFYFLVGLWLAPLLLPGGRKGPRPGATIADPAWLSAIRRRPTIGIAALIAWFLLQVVLVRTGVDQMVGLSLIIGLTGAAALLLAGILLSTFAPSAVPTRLLRLVGERSIIIYLVFTIPMAMIREALLRLAPGLPVDVVSLAVLIGAVSAALVVERLVRGSPLEPLFSRPVLNLSGTGSPGPGRG